MLKKIVAVMILGAALMTCAPAYAEVDVNTASQQQLESLPGIGPKKAQAIIAGRPYRTVDELDRVPGIGPKILEQLRPEVTVGDGESREQQEEKEPEMKD